LKDVNLASDSETAWSMRRYLHLRGRGIRAIAGGKRTGTERGQLPRNDAEHFF